MAHSKSTLSVTLTVRLSPRANEGLRRLAGRPRSMGKTIGELVAAELARQELREEYAKAQKEEE